MGTPLYWCGTNFTASASTLPSALLLTETMPPWPAANLKVPSRFHLPFLFRRLTRIVLVPSSDLTVNGALEAWSEFGSSPCHSYTSYIPAILTSGVQVAVLAAAPAEVPTAQRVPPLKSAPLSPSVRSPSDLKPGSRSSIMISLLEAEAPAGVAAAAGAAGAAGAVFGAVRSEEHTS